ncbi:hypothetical protein pb186bvf_008839 [Paramecium bursaria]
MLVEINETLDENMIHIIAASYYSELGIMLIFKIQLITKYSVILLNDIFRILNKFIQEIKKYQYLIT